MFKPPVRPGCRGQARLLKVLMAWVLGLSAPSALAAPPAMKLAVLGSSTAAGQGASSLAKSWVGMLTSWAEKQQGQSVRNFAISGALTSSAVCASQITAEAQESVRPLQSADRAILSGATHLLLSFPSNDATAGVAVSATLSNLLGIKRCAESAGLKVAVLSTLPRSGLSAEQKKAISLVEKQLRLKFGACYIDVYPSLAEQATAEPARALSAGDGVHYNDRGHAVIYAAVRRFVESGSCF